MNRYDQFHEFRTRMNERILDDEATLVTKRFFGIDTRTYEGGTLDSKTKHMLGLVASMVLRCDDCIAFHVDASLNEGVTEAELRECFDVALVVGGSIVIPHLRRALEFVDDRRASLDEAPDSS